MGKRWNNPALLAELAETEGAPELVKFWWSPVFGERCSLADAALATGLPPGRVIVIGKRTLRYARWLSRIAADPDLAKASPDIHLERVRPDVAEGMLHPD